MTPPYWIYGISCLWLFLLYTPLFELVVNSFRDPLSLWSWHWYHLLFQDLEIFKCLLNSLKIALASATLATIVGALFGFIWMQQFHEKQKWHDFKYQLSQIILIPQVIPDIVMGLGFMLLFNGIYVHTGWRLSGIMPTILAHATVGLGFVGLLLKHRLAEFDFRLEEAALDLGARPHSVFISIVLPLLMPTLLMGWLFVFIISLDDVILASFTSGPGSSTLPQYLLSSLRLGITPMMNALGSFILCIMTLVTCMGCMVYRAFFMHHNKKL
jgi:putrescine transport system permease protein